LPPSTANPIFSASLSLLVPFRLTDTWWPHRKHSWSSFPLLPFPTVLFSVVHAQTFGGCQIASLLKDYSFLLPPFSPSALGKVALSLFFPCSSGSPIPSFKVNNHTKALPSQAVSYGFSNFYTFFPLSVFFASDERRQLMPMLPSLSHLVFFLSGLSLSSQKRGWVCPPPCDRTTSPNGGLASFYPDCGITITTHACSSTMCSPLCLRAISKPH